MVVRRSDLQEGDYSCSCLRLIKQAYGAACHPPETATRRRFAPLINNLTAHYNSKLCISFNFFFLTGKPSGASKLVYMGQKITMVFSKLYCLDLILEKLVMPTSPLPHHLLTQVWHEAIPSVFMSWVSGAGRFGELQLQGWTPVMEDGACAELLWYSVL